MTAPKPDVAAVARGLTKAQRAALQRLKPDWWAESWECASLHYQRPSAALSSLVSKGLAARRYHLEKRPTEYLLTPLGLLVRAHLLSERPTDAG